MRLAALSAYDLESAVQTGRSDNTDRSRPRTDSALQWNPESMRPVFPDRRYQDLAPAQYPVFPSMYSHIPRQESLHPPEHADESDCLSAFFPAKTLRRYSTASALIQQAPALPSACAPHG